MPVQVKSRDHGNAVLLTESETNAAIAAATVGLAPLLVGNGSPVGITAGLLAQLYYDQVANLFYRCTSNPSGTVWTLE